MTIASRADIPRFAKSTFVPTSQRSDMAKLVMSQARLETKLFWRHDGQTLLTIIILLAMLIGLAMMPVFELDHPLECISLMALVVSVIPTGFTGQVIAVGFDRRYEALRCIGTPGVPPWGIIAGKIASVCTTVTLQHTLFGPVGSALGAGLSISGWPLAYVGTPLRMFVSTSLDLLMGGMLGTELILGLASLIWFILTGAIIHVVVVPSLDDISSALLHLLPSAAFTSVISAVSVTSVHRSVVGMLIVRSVPGAALAVRWPRSDMPNDQESVGESAEKSVAQCGGLAYYHSPPAWVELLNVNIVD